MGDNILKNQNIKFIFVIIGLVVLLLSYILVYRKFDTKASDVKDEKNSLNMQYDSLNQKNVNRKKYQKDTKEIKQKTEDLLKKFDAGITDESQIMDCFNISNEIGVSITNLTINPIDPAKNYVFGKIASSNPDAPGVAGLDPSYAGISKGYTISLTGTYDQVKQYLTNVMSTSGKRKVPMTVSIAYDSAISKATLSATFTEYAVTGNDRKMQDVMIPSFNSSTTNIFYSSLTPSIAQ